jgi:hypothetical protein
MTDEEFHQTAATARTLAAMGTVDDRLAAAQARGDIPAAIAAKREKHSYTQTNGNTEGTA